MLKFVAFVPIVGVVVSFFLSRKADRTEWGVVGSDGVYLKATLEEEAFDFFCKSLLSSALFLIPSFFICLGLLVIFHH